MKLFGRKKKTDNNAAAQKDANGTEAVEALQEQVRYLEERMFSMRGKMSSQTSSSAPSFRPGLLPGTSEGSFQEYDGDSRNSSFARSLGSRNAHATDHNVHHGYNPRHTASGDIANHNGAAAAAHYHEDVRYAEHPKNSIPAKTSSLASSKGEGEVYYKNGKKYRRVVRVVRSTGPAESGRAGSGRHLDKPSSSRSVSSTHGREEVSDGHVEAMRARYLNSSATSDVSIGSKSSCASRNFGGTKPGSRVRTPADSYQFGTPKLQEQKKSASQKQWDERPSPLPSNANPNNPWLRNSMQRTKSIEKARGIPEPPLYTPVDSPWTNRDPRHAGDTSRPANSPFTNPKNLRIGVDSPYTKSSSDTRKSRGAPESHHPKILSESERSGVKPVLKSEKVQRQGGWQSPEPIAVESSSRRKDPAPTKITAQSGGRSGAKALTKRQAAKPSKSEIAPPPPPGGPRTHARSALDHTSRQGGQERGGKEDERKSRKTETTPSATIPSNRGFKFGPRKKPDNPTTGRTLGSGPIEVQSKPKDLLKQIQKQNVKLKKAPLVKEQAVAPSPHSQSAPKPKALHKQIQKPKEKLNKAQPVKIQAKPKALLQQIQKQDVQLTKTPPVEERAAALPMHSHAASPGTKGDLLAGIRAGVQLKKVDKSAQEAPKPRGDPMMTQLLASFQQRKNQCSDDW